jgi:hypothetical protein
MLPMQNLSLEPIYGQITIKRWYMKIYWNIPKEIGEKENKSVSINLKLIIFMMMLIKPD